jgi:predicted DNA binding CopG/RHH family protein
MLRRAFPNHIRSQSHQGRAETILGKVKEMRKEYDFAKAKRNPYARLLKRQVTIRLDEETVSYFKKIAKEAGIPYQTLINLYLRDCAASGRKLSLEWRSS